VRCHVLEGFLISQGCILKPTRLPLCKTHFLDSGIVLGSHIPKLEIDGLVINNNFLTTKIGSNGCFVRTIKFFAHILTDNGSLPDLGVTGDYDFEELALLHLNTD